MVLSGSILDAKTVIVALRAKTRLSATDLDVLADMSNCPFEGDFDGSADESDAQIRRRWSTPRTGTSNGPSSNRTCDDHLNSGVVTAGAVFRIRDA